MSTAIDERVVEMRFDNKRFESNVQTSLSTLDKLKKSLNMDGAAKGFENIDNAAKKINMNGLGSAVENVKLKFSALEVMAVTALANITNSVVNTGKQLISSFTIAPIKSGFQEYETQINAVQTILANTEHEGTNLQQVNRALDELNTYADKTIYNFTEMTRNIGTFTAAGVDLRTSVDSIKGIANLAAVSGSTSQQASTAMYQLSQALAAGKVSLMDWNSVVNAGMGGKVFQDALVRTSELLGTGAKQAIYTYGSFRESLTKGEWMTTEVLTETLKQFAGAYTEADLIQQGFSKEQAKSIAKMAETAENAATKVKTFTQLWDTLQESAQSGWTQTWEIIIGDFGEAKELLTEISDSIGGMITKTAEARNEILSGGLSSGWKQLLDQGIADEAGYIDAIQEVARENGDAFDKMVTDSESFSDALKKGLKDEIISSETLSQAVYNLKDKMSGMSEEELKTAGYTREMVEQIEKLDSGLRDGSISMDEFTEKILRPSGRENLIQALWNTAKGLMSIIKPIKEAFREIFPPLTAQQLYDFTENLRKLTERFTLSETASENLKSTFKGLFAVIDIVGKAFSAVFKAVGSLFGGVGKLGGSILGVTGSFGEWLVKLDETIEKTDVFNKVLGKIVDFIKAAATAVKNFISNIAKKFKMPGFELFHNVLERVQKRMSQVGDAAGNMKSGVVIAFESMGEALANCQFVKLIQAIWNAVKTIMSGIVNTLGQIGGYLSSNLGEANFSGIIDLLNGISFAAIAAGITKFVGGFSKAIKDIGSIKKSFIGILDGVKDCFKAYQSQLKAGILLKIAAAIAILSASLIALSLMDSDKLNGALGGITILFADLMASMTLFDKFGGNSKGVIKSIAAMLGIATAVLILAGALKKIGNLNATQLTTGLIGVAALSGIMVAVAKIMSSNSKKFSKGATQIVILAAAIKILASVCKDLAKLGWDELAKGLVGVGTLLVEVSIFMNTAKFSLKSITTATGIVILSAAIKILASACKDFGSMKWEQIHQGLVGIGLLLAEIAGFTKLTGNVKHVISTGIALIAISAAMKIFASAVSDFGNMQWDKIGRGLTAMAGSLAAVTLAINFMPKNMIRIGTGLVIVGAALEIIAHSMGKMGNFSYDRIEKSLVVMGSALAELAIGLNLMKGTLGGSAALLVASSALLILTPVLSILGAMSWRAIAKGLIALAGAFVIIGAAGLVLTPLIPAILGLSAAITLMGVAVLGIGAGLALAGADLSALALGLTALAAAGTAGATAIVASLTIIITGIAGLIPAVVAKIGEAVIEFCKVIAGSAGAIGKAFKEVLFTLIDVLVECIPAIADGALKLIDEVLKSLVEYTPSIVDSVFQFLIGILEGVAKNLPDLIQAAVGVLMSFFSGIINALKGIDTETLLQGIAGIGLLSAIMVTLSAVAALTPGAMIGVLGMGAVIAELALVLAAIGALAQIPGLEWLIGEGGNLLQGIGTAIGKFVGGIAGGFMSGVSSQFPQIGSDLSAFMTNVQPFIDGASNIKPSMMDGAKALADTILILTAANILEGLTSWFTGGSSLSDFAKDLIPFGTAMKQFSEEVKDIGADDISSAATAGKVLAEMAATLPNAGGVAGFFAGENDMDTFGEQLIPFGRAIKGFSVAVDGLKVDVVRNASTAGKTVAEMAATLPNSGGVLGFFAGENDMDTFGEQLVSFGKAITEYSQSVVDLKSDAIQNSVSAAKSLVEIANTLDNSGGVVSWFTGDNNMDTFGKQLVSFGKSFAEYYDSVSNIEASQLNGVIVEFQNLVDVANGIKNVDTSGMTNFAQNLTDLGNTGIDGFINAFTNANSRVSAAANNMMIAFINGINIQNGTLTIVFTAMVSSIITAFTNQYHQFTTIGSTVMVKLIAGVKLKDITLRSAFVTIISGCLTSIRNKYQDFNNVGQATMTNLIAGIRSKDYLTKDVYIQIVNRCITEIRNKYNDFYDVGRYLVEGFAKGIDEYTWYAEAKSRAMASAAARAAENELDINSPSKVGYRIGGFFGMGFVNAIIDYTDRSYDAGTAIASSAKDGLHKAVSNIRDFIDDNIDHQPAIRPVIDLSSVQSGAKRLSAILSQSQAMKINSDIERNASKTIQNGDNTPAVGNSYSFTQNNYSPKALSKVEIYRQTKNQFSAMKRMVNI